jgi:hypothetical protein
VKQKEHKTTGIDQEEIQRRKGTGECLRCAWPSDRKGAHQVRDCVRPIKLDKGTASYPKAREYLKLEKAFQQLESEELNYDESDTDSSSDKSL